MQVFGHINRGAFNMCQFVTLYLLLQLLEFRIPVLGDGRLKLAPFFDMGRAWSLDGSDQKQHVLNSAGIGLLFDPIPEIHSELFWAHAMRTIKNNSQDLQDDGIHFAVTYSPL